MGSFGDDLFLLKGLPHLQELVVNIDVTISLRMRLDNISTVNWDPHDEAFGGSLSCQLQQLKTIKIHGFMGSKCNITKDLIKMTVDEFIDSRPGEILLVKTLLKNCGGLDKMILRNASSLDRLSKQKFSQLQINLLKRLLLLPRGCQSAQIVFA